MQVGGSSARYMSLESGSIQAAMIVPPFNHLAKKHGFNQLLGFNDIMSMPVGGLAVHTQKMKEKPDEIVKMIRALIKSLEYIRTRKADILAMIDKQWGVKEADVREDMYREMLGLFSRTGIGPDEAHAKRHPAGARNAQERAGSRHRRCGGLELRAQSAVSESCSCV